MEEVEERALCCSLNGMASPGKRFQDLQLVCRVVEKIALKTCYIASSMSSPKGCVSIHASSYRAQPQQEAQARNCHPSQSAREH